MWIRGMLCAVMVCFCLVGCATMTKDAPSSGESKLSEISVDCSKDRCLAMLKMRHGDTLSGKLMTRRFVVRTTMGDIYLPINEIKNIKFNVVEANNQDKVEFYGATQRHRTRRTNQVTGHIEPETITMLIEASGQQLSFTQDQIAELESLGQR